MLLKIYLKEMKDSFRDTRTLFLMIFLPIIMMAAMTLFYEKLVSDGKGETFKLAVATSISAEEEMILSSYENIKIVKGENPEQLLTNGDAQAALVFSEGFISSIQKGEDASVTLIGDSFSQKSANLMNIVGNALAVYEKAVVAERLQTQGTDLEVIQPFAIEHMEISGEDPAMNAVTLLIPLILALAIGIGAAPAAADFFAGEKERKTMEALLMTPVKRSTLLFAKWLAISTIGTIVGVVTMVVVALEIAFLTENLRNAVAVGDEPVLVIGAGVLVSILYAMFIASLHMLTSIIGKTVKEAQSYSTPVMLVTMFPIMIISTMSINEMTFVHFAIPVMNLISLLKELLFGIVNGEHILITVASNLIGIIVIFIIGRILFLKDKWVMS